MRNTCLHCNTPFPYRRVSRKYCSNSCKQLDYYNRKKELSGTYFIQPENNLFIVKEDEFTVKPLIVKEKPISVKKDVSVKHFTIAAIDSVKEDTVKPLSVKKEALDYETGISDEQLEVLAEKILLLLEKRIDEIIYRKTFSVKDALSVKESLNVKDTVKEAFSVKENEFTVKENDVSVKDTVKDTVKEDEITVKENDVIVNDSVKETQEYKFINSTLIDNITEHLNRDNSDALSKFLYPHLYWSASYISKVKWVSLRFKCLVESLIELSKFRYIDSENLFGVAKGLEVLENSKHFKALGNDYPHKELIKELKGKITSMFNGHKNPYIFFVIQPERKAELIATRFEIGNFVPKIKFSELDFTE